MIIYVDVCVYTLYSSHTACYVVSEALQPSPVKSLLQSVTKMSKELKDCDKVLWSSLPLRFVRHVYFIHFYSFFILFS